MSGIRKSIPDTELLMARVGFKLPVANTTRWSSQFRMVLKFQEALEQDPTIQDSLAAFKVHGKFSYRELKIVKELISILQPFQETTDEWQRDSETIGTVIPAYLHMKNTLNGFVRPGSLVSICKDFAKALLNSLDRRFEYVLGDTYYVLGNKLEAFV